MSSATLHLLFVCLGNICRSPAAEGVMRAKVAESDLADRIVIDSAGTANWHTGKLADPRMRTAASRRGYDLQSRARAISPEDFSRFDLILVMDEQNLRNVLALTSDPTSRARVHLFSEFCTAHDLREVPDPYEGGPEGFELVLDLLEDGCDGLLQHLRQRLA